MKLAFSENRSKKNGPAKKGPGGGVPGRGQTTYLEVSKSPTTLGRAIKVTDTKILC